MPPSFPIYRRSRNGRHFYRIEGDRAFTEVQLLGGRAVIHRIRDAAYPEQVRINAMLGMEDGAFVDCGEEEFLRALDQHDGR